MSVVARSAHLATIRANGVAVESPRGMLHARVQATDDPASLGVQDVVFLALKSHQVIAALDGVQGTIRPPMRP